MNKKPVSEILLTLFLVSILMLASDIFSARSFATWLNESMASRNQLAEGTVVLQQNFDNEVTGKVPKDWELTRPEYGNFTVDGTVYYGKTGKSAKVVDNSTESSPDPYRNFTEQSGTIVVSFAIRLANKTNLKVSIDDGSGNGANIVFWEIGDIGYRECDGRFVCLRDSYIPNRWYRIKMIMNIPENVYNIHIDDHLEVINANFTGACSQVHRLIIMTRDSMYAIGYIDNIEIRRCIKIPEDFPTIQEGIDAASPGDTVFVSGKRIYFENVIIRKNIWLVGENVSTTVIDGQFIKTPERESNGISVIQCSNVTVYGFTIKNSEANGVYIEGSNNTINNNIINNSLGCGIRVVGSGNTLSSNTIFSNLKHGISICGSNSTVTNNLVESNLDCGIYIGAGENNLVKKNKIRSNVVGVKCDACTKNNTIYQNRFVCNDLQALDYGSNKWDDSYPYVPKEEKGGGNYWSDFNATDLYSGVNQDECDSCCSPLPDGICDTPYIVKPKNQDNYPLFLIQKVSQNPDPSLKNVTYDKAVAVNATLLEDVQVEEAYLYVQSKRDGTLEREKIKMTMSKNYALGTIPAKQYRTNVTYYVSVRATCKFVVWVNSTNYPLPKQYYYVWDERPPNIEKVDWEPKMPNENKTISVYAIVSDWDSKASQVDKVLLLYFCKESNRWWKTEMTRAKQPNNYTAIIPKQPSGRLDFAIDAFDKAGNKAEKNYTISNVKTPAKLVLQQKIGTEYKGCTDPCNIDFEVMSKEQTKENRDYRIYNDGQEDLAWEIVELKPNPWFDIKPLKGVTSTGKWTNLTITVSTKGCPETGIYMGEFSIKANGTKPEWTIIMRVTVRHIIIDDSWASSEAPNRCDVNSNQNYTFHVIWAHNCSDTNSGKIRISNVGWIDVNETGWASFTYNLASPGTRTFQVEEVSFSYKHDNTIYYITSFTQKAPRRTTIWDRVKINLIILDDRIDVCSEANVSWNASVYEYDGSAFSGTVHFNDTLHHDIVGKWYITASSINDAKFNLKAFQSNIVWCIWDRIRIIGGGISNPQTYTGQLETVWFIAIYEYDNQVFKGTMEHKLFLDVSANASIIFIDDPLIWSYGKDQWEKGYSFDTEGTRTFKISRAVDTLYQLTKVEDSVGPLNITWRTPPPSPPPSSPPPPLIQDWPAIVIVSSIALAVIIVAFLALWIIGKEQGH